MALPRRIILAILCLFAILPAQALAADGQLRALVLSGKNNHAWQETTPALKQTLEASGRFTLRILDDPTLCTGELLKDYDLIISNWTNFPDQQRIWGPVADNAILQFVRSGKGFALFHAAGACFPSWPEFQQLIGATWGEKTGHGPYRRFNVSVMDTAHPITRVIGDFTAEDELWHRMQRDPGARVLCTAYSDTVGGGTGQQEPVVYTTEFGQGRGFYLVLGHDARAMMNPNVRMLLLRGAEWAATGQASIEVPCDVPATLRKATGFSGTTAQEKMTDIRQLVQSSSRNRTLRRAIARGMVDLLNTTTPPAWRKFFSEELSLIGTSEEVPALTRLLADPSLAFQARFALERIPGGLSAAMSDSLTRRAEAFEAAGNVREAAAIYASMNMPREPAHVRLAGFAGLVRTQPEEAPAMVLSALKSNDNILLSAVVQALREPSGRQLAGAVAPHVGRVPAGPRAQMLAALADLGERSVLQEMYRSLSHRDGRVRMAALYGIGRLGDASSVDPLCAVIGRAGTRERAEAKRSLARLQGPGVDERLLALLEGRSSSALKEELIAALAARNHRAAVPALMKVAQGPRPAERKAAIKALGSLADPPIATELVNMLTSGRYSDERTSLVRALVALGTRDQRPDHVRDVVLAKLPNTPPEMKEPLFRVLGEFGGEKALQVVRSAVSDPNPEVRNAAVRVLSSWPDSSPLNDLFTLARTSETTGSRLLALRGGIALLEKSTDLGDSDRLRIIEQEMQHAEGPEARRLFVSLLGKQTSLQALQYTLSCMDQPGVTDEAALAVTAIAKATGKTHTAETRTALEKALRPNLSSSVAQEVRSSLKALEPTMDQKTIKAAIVTGGHEFDEQAFTALFKDLRGINVTFLHQKDDSEIFEDVTVWPYDVVVLYNMTRKISEKRQRNFLQLLDEGVGLLSMHHASAAFQDWKEFRKIIGVRYRLAAEEENGERREASTYQHDVRIPVRVADTSHPVTRGVSDFVILDETYKGCAFEPDNHMLITTTAPTSDPALGWARTYGRARVVHLQLGHGPSGYSEPPFRRIVEQALRWCAEGKPEKVSRKGADNE